MSRLHRRISSIDEGLSIARKILITGGCGFIGSHLADRLLSDGARVAVIDDLSTGRRDNLSDEAEFHQGCITDRDFVQNVFDTVRPEVVIHMAARINTSVVTERPLDDVDISVRGTLNLIELGLRAGIAKFVHASSVSVYGSPPPETLPLSEEARLAPIYSYGIAKKCAEEYLRFHGQVHGLDFHIARYANIYGPRQPIFGEVGVIAIFSERVCAGEPLTVFGDGAHLRDYLYVDDAVDATVRLIDLPGSETFNVASGRPTSVNEVFDSFAAAADRPLERRTAPERIGELGRFWANTAKIEAALDWRPRVALADGVQRTMEYARRN